MKTATLSFSQACENNKGPILSVLRQVFANSQHVLEIGSGTGQHAVHFAAGLPHLSWQPSDQPMYLPDLSTRVSRSVKDLTLVNLLAPLALDIRQQQLTDRRFDAVFSANTLHIMNWPVVQQLFARLPMLTTDNAKLCIYGPFNYNGAFTSSSNAAFDANLKSRDSTMGIRDIEAVLALAAEAGFMLENDHEMPANNRLLQF
ncbi:MAG TPA: DUF938 domain-containing protein, partial [Rheinheimera sp.]|nr:DUF938 domain-containing protein [Rheinheimera sp.]